MDKYYVCLPRRWSNDVCVEEIAQKYDLVITDVTKMYRSIYKKWSCEPMFVFIGDYDNIMRYIAESYLDSVSNATEYSKYLRVFEL